MMQQCISMLQTGGYLQLSLTGYKPITLTQEIISDQGILTFKRYIRFENSNRY